MKQRRPIAVGELLAIDQRVVKSDADSIFFLFSPYAPENEYADGIACVHIRGPLDHHAGWGDSYDAIRQRAQEAFECDEAQAVIFKIDSPGGAVSGLLDTVRAIRLMSEASAKPCIAYVDERAFSAAYALASPCDEIWIPRSGILGSVGVISTMAEQVERDEMMGYRFVTITSGARKSDGHIHVPITDDAVAAETERVMELAGQFWELVSDFRGLSVKRIRDFQAGLFLGAKAVDSGLADRVGTFDELVAHVKKGLAHSGTGVPTSSTRVPIGKEQATMKGLRNKLVAQVKETRQAIAKLSASATDAKEKIKLEGKLSGLQAALEAYEKTTERHIEHHKTKESGDEDEDEEGNETDRGDSEEDDEEKGDEDDDEEARAGKAKQSASAKSKPGAKGGKAKAKYAEEDDEEEAKSEDDEEEAALAEVVRRATGKTGVAARGAFAAMMGRARQADTLSARVSTMERERRDEKRAATIQSALVNNRITKREAKELAGKPMAYVDAFLEARPRSLVVTQDGELEVPSTLPTGEARLPEELENMLAQAMAASEGKITREQFLADYKARNATLNGRGGPI